MSRTIVATLILLLVSHVEASSFYSYPAIDLDSAKSVTLSAESKTGVVVFFEPNCSWCFKQAKVFNRFLKRCNTDVQFTGLGVNGNRQQLKKEAWRLKAKFPLYMAGSDLLNATGHISSTPLTLILDEKGSVVAHTRGYLPFNKWKAFLDQHTATPVSCSRGDLILGIE